MLLGLKQLTVPRAYASFCLNCERQVSFPPNAIARTDLCRTFNIYVVLALQTIPPTIMFTSSFLVLNLYLHYVLVIMYYLLFCILLSMYATPHVCPRSPPKQNRDGCRELEEMCVEVPHMAA